MREIATKKKPVFVQANFNSGQGHVLHYITSFCVVIRLSTLYFWLAGKTETKQVVKMSWRGRQLKRPGIRAGGFYFSRGFAARSRALRARICRLRRSCARLDKTAMLRRLWQRAFNEKGFTWWQKTLWNSAGSPSAPGILFEAFVF